MNFMQNITREGKGKGSSNRELVSSSPAQGSSDKSCIWSEFFAEEPQGVPGDAVVCSKDADCCGYRPEGRSYAKCWMGVFCRCTHDIEESMACAGTRSWHETYLKKPGFPSWHETQQQPSQRQKQIQQRQQPQQQQEQ